LFFPPPIPGIPNCARTTATLKRKKTKNEERRREEEADDDDDDDDDVQKKACRVLAERAKGEKFLGTFVRVHGNKIFMQQVV
jgi:hypothetical protein